MPHPRTRSPRQCMTDGAHKRAGKQVNTQYGMHENAQSSALRPGTFLSKKWGGKKVESVCRRHGYGMTRCHAHSCVTSLARPTSCLTGAPSQVGALVTAGLLVGAGLLVHLAACCSPASGGGRVTGGGPSKVGKGHVWGGMLPAVCAKSCTNGHSPVCVWRSGERRNQVMNDRPEMGLVVFAPPSNLASARWMECLSACPSSIREARRMLRRGIRRHGKWTSQPRHDHLPIEDSALGREASCQVWGAAVYTLHMRSSWIKRAARPATPIPRRRAQEQTRVQTHVQTHIWRSAQSVQAGSHGLPLGGHGLSSVCPATAPRTAATPHLRLRSSAAPPARAGVLAACPRRASGLLLPAPPPWSEATYTQNCVFANAVAPLSAGVA